MTNVELSRWAVFETPEALSSRSGGGEDGYGYFRTVLIPLTVEPMLPPSEADAIALTRDELPVRDPENPIVVSLSRRGSHIPYMAIKDQATRFTASVFRQRWSRYPDVSQLIVSCHHIGRVLVARGINLDEGSFTQLLEEGIPGLSLSEEVTGP